MSDALGRALGENGIVGVETIHTGIDPEAWQSAPAATAAFTGRFNLAGKCPILFAGRLSADKGGAQALEAFAEVAKEVPSALLLIAGPEDGYAAGMMKEAERRGFAGQVAATGWLAHEEMRAAYAAAALVWVPSTYLDPFPRTVLEAMAAGRPVIATTYGGAGEAVEEGVTGFVVNPFDTRAWAEVSVALLTDSERAAAFGEAARSRIEREFNLSRYAAQYVAAYERALGNQSAHPLVT